MKAAVETPASPDGRPLLPNELLRPNDLIYEPAVLARIRTWAEGKRILVVDYNGVIGGDGEEGDIINPQAQESLVKLRDLGYTLVLWTSAMRDRVDILNQNDLAKYFSLFVTAEMTGTW